MPSDFEIDSKWVEEYLYITALVDTDRTTYIQIRCELCTEQFAAFLPGYPRNSDYVAKALAHYDAKHKGDVRYTMHTPSS